MRESKKESSKDSKKDIKKSESSNIITLDEFKFSHAVFMLESSVLKDDLMINAYTKFY